MGRLIVPAAGAVYVDSNSVIYRVEGLEPFATASLPLWEALDEERCQVVTSDLTLLEVLVRPVRDGNLNLIEIYREILLDTEDMTSIPIDRDILERAASLRATHRLKTPDSIHAATAIRSAAVLFVTNDADFRKIPGLSVVLLGELASSEPGTESD